MDERALYIRSEYIHKRSIIRTCTSEMELLSEMEQAVQSKDIYFLLQIWAESANFCAPLPSNWIHETALHTAIGCDFDCSALHIVDFLVKNSPNLNAQTRPDRNTALHYCVIYKKPQCMKLFLHSKTDFLFKNSDEKRPMGLDQ